MRMVVAISALMVCELAVADLCGMPDDAQVVATIRAIAVPEYLQEVIAQEGPWGLLSAKRNDELSHTENARWDHTFGGQISLPDSPYCRYPSIETGFGNVQELRVYRLKGNDLPTVSAGDLLDFFGGGILREAGRTEKYEVFGDPSEWSEESPAGRCDLPEDEATVVVWRTPSGCWSGCGPKACTDVSKKELADVFRLVYEASSDTLGETCELPMLEGAAERLSGVVTIYRLNRKLSHSDVNAQAAWPRRDKGDGAVATLSDLRERDCHF